MKYTSRLDRRDCYQNRWEEHTHTHDGRIGVRGERKPEEVPTELRRTFMRPHFSVLLNQPGSHRRGRTLGLFSSFCISLMRLPLLRCLPSFFIARRVQPSLSLVDNEVEFCLLTKLFSFLSLSTTIRYESEKNPLPPRFEPVTWSLEGHVDTN